MKVNLSKFNRTCLSREQKEALILLAPLSMTISSWIKSKCRFLGKPGDLFTSIILGDILVESEFLSCPLSKPTLDGKNSNNLVKISDTREWTGKTIEYEGKRYKAYRDWLHFASDYSDILTFSSKYDRVLAERDRSRQLTLFSQFKVEPEVFEAKVEAYTDFYGLAEWDH